MLFHVFFITIAFGCAQHALRVAVKNQSFSEKGDQDGKDVNILNDGLMGLRWFGLIMKKLKGAIVFKYLKKCHVIEGQPRTNGRQILAHYKKVFAKLS